MKKFTAVILCCLMLICAVCGCSEKSGGSADSEASSVTACKRVGQSQYGYIDIPEDWSEHIDETASASGMLQYSDAAANNIITMQFFTNTDAQTTALNMWGLLESSVQNLTSAIVEIGGVKTYQLYGAVPDIGKIMALWILDDTSGITHCITIEGTREEIFDLAETFAPFE